MRARWLLLVVTLARPALACPCSDDAGSASALTRPSERYALSLVATSRQALGRFDAQGEHHSLGDAESETSEELLLRAGVRATPRWEWLAELGAASYRLRAGRVVVNEQGLGDAGLRTRYELLDEAMPHEALPWPAVAVAALVRAPLGQAVSRRNQGFGSGGAQLGLGTWELGGGVDVTRSLTGTLPLSFGLAVEGAYRLPDETLDVARRLGPRFDASLWGRADVGRGWSTSLGLRARAAANMTYAGQELPGTGERLLTLLTGASFYDAPSGLRTSVTLAIDPPFRLLSASAASTVALGVAVAYGSN